MAANKPATCATLQSVLDGAANTDVITLNSSDGTNGRCTGQYILKDFGLIPLGGTPVQWTLQGDPTNGQDGFDRNGAQGRALTGVNVQRLEIQNLEFRDGNETAAGTEADNGNGGAISVTGHSGVAIRLSSFFNNTASGNGGAVHMSQPSFDGIVGGVVASSTFGGAGAGAGNSALGNGGAVSIETPGQGQNSSINSNTFTNNSAVGNGGAFDFVIGPAGAENISLVFNTVIGNRAEGSGGGGHVVVRDATLLRVDQELYQGNSLGLVRTTGSPSAGDHFGAGLHVDNGGSQMLMRDNTFDVNHIDAIANGEDYGGGALAVTGNSFFSRSDFGTFTHNTVVGQPDSDFESEGGAIAIIGTSNTFHGWLNVVAGNSVGALGEGGGIYTGASNTSLELSDSTVVGNTVGAGGSGAGLQGGGDDQLRLHNSIVYNTPLPDIAGFNDVPDVVFSDACQPNGTSSPFDGDGDICADPKLVDPAGGDIHQTKQSPTIDKGNDALFFGEEEGPDRDFEGDPRPTDGDGNGHTVDMGADESPAGFIAPPKPILPPPTPQCSDGVDNDADGAIDKQDPGCLSATNSKYNAADVNEGDEGIGDLVLCGRRTISLVRADARGKKVSLTGLVQARFAGKKVGIFANSGHGWKKLTTKKADAGGQFKAKVDGPPARLFNKVRYQARIGKSRSIALKLPQSLASNSVKQQGDSIVLKGKIKRSVLGKRNVVIIRRLVCGHYQKAGEAKPGKSGKYTIRFKAPKLAAAALYRAEAMVLARPGSKRYVKQYARAVGIKLSGQTG